MSDRAPRYSTTPRLLVLTYIMMASLASLGLPRLASSAQVGIAVLLILLVALAFARAPNSESPQWKIHGYFALHTILIGSLLVLAPQGRRIFAVLFLMTSGQATLFLPRAAGFVWVGIFVAVLSAAFIYLGGLADVVAQLFPFPGGYILTGVFAYLWKQTDMARYNNQRLLAELQTANTQLQQYAARIEELAVADERNRIAREIHDTLGHALTALDVQLELLVRLPPQQADQRQHAAESARGLVKQGLADVRRAVQALRPVALEAFSLPEAITALVQEVKRTTGVEVAWQVQGAGVALPPRLALPLYRAAQESLTNVRRHARRDDDVVLHAGGGSPVRAECASRFAAVADGREQRRLWPGGFARACAGFGRNVSRGLRRRGRFLRRDDAARLVWCTSRTLRGWVVTCPRKVSLLRVTIQPRVRAGKIVTEM